MMVDWQSTGVNTLFGLIGAGLGGLVTHLWQTRRTSDREYFLVLRGAFDRPAFRGPYVWHSDHEAFRQAIAVTLKAVKTGKLLDRRGEELNRVEGRFRGPFNLHNSERRKTVQHVEDLLQRILHGSQRISTAADSINDDARLLIDKDRDQVIGNLNAIWRYLAIAEMRLPTEVKVYEAVQEPRA